MTGGGGGAGGNQSVNVNSQGAGGDGKPPGFMETAFRHGADGKFGARLGEALGTAVGTLARGTVMAAKDGLTGGASFANGMKDAVISAGNMGGAAFRNGADAAFAAQRNASTAATPPAKA